MLLVIGQADAKSDFPPPRFTLGVILSVVRTLPSASAEHGQ